jgi:hypothetical protein
MMVFPPQVSPGKEPMMALPPQVLPGQQPILCFERLNPASGHMEAITNISVNYFESIEAQMRSLYKKRIRKEAESVRQSRRYVIYEKQPEAKEKKKKVSFDFVLLFNCF